MENSQKTSYLKMKEIQFELYYLLLRIYYV